MLSKVQEEAPTPREGACEAALPALNYGDCEGWAPGCQVGGFVQAVSSATEASCEQAQRPIESPPTPAPGLSPTAPCGRGGRASAQECARSWGRGPSPTKPFSTRAWEGHRLLA